MVKHEIEFILILPVLVDTNALLQTFAVHEKKFFRLPVNKLGLFMQTISELSLLGGFTLNQ